MVEDKWNARGEGRKEQKTHQPTGGRGNQGGLRIGEMERDALLGHGIASFIQESYMKRSDGTVMTVCNGCGNVPIYNKSTNLYICSLCDGPVQFIGDSASTFEILPSLKRSVTSFSEIEIPYSLEVFNKELNTYMNMYLRYLTTKDVSHIRKMRNGNTLSEKEIKQLLATELQERILKDMNNVEIKEEEPEVKVNEEQLKQLGEEKEEDIQEVIEETLPQISVVKAKSAVDEFTILDESDVDDISVTQSVVTTVAQPKSMVMVMPLETAMKMNTLVQSQVPQAPPTLVVDTSEQAMKSQGLPTVQDEVKLRPILKRSTASSPTRGNQQQKTSKTTTFSINKLGSEGTQPQEESSNNTRTINIIKEE